MDAQTNRRDTVSTGENHDVVLGRTDDSCIDPAELNALLPDQYAVLELVAHGGVGAVYKATNRFTGALLAIKILRKQYWHDHDFINRFIEEARAAQSLDDPRICRALDFGMTDRHFPFLVMEWIDGVSLRSKVEQQGPLSVDDAVPIFMEVAQALHHAHERKLLHRDLKPDNVMLQRTASGGRAVRLVDFGLAKFLDTPNSLNLTRTGEVVGTPLYMSPEQARGLQLDARSDIYAFGCLMYFTLTGSAPFVGQNFVDTMYKHLLEDPPAPDESRKLPSGIKRIIMKSLEKNPADRYQSLQLLHRDLQRCLAGAPLVTYPLAKKRQFIRSLLMTLVWFVIGFLAMFAVTVLVKHFVG